MNTSVDSLRHPKEQTYFTVLAVIAVLIWIPLIPFALFGIPITLMVLLFVWLSLQYFKAVILGDSVKVSPSQYPEIYERAENLRVELGMSSLPEIYILNSHGIVQATAARVLGNKYIFLYSSLVDLMLLKGHSKELDFILGHELGHHAAGHISIWKSVLLVIVKHFPLIGKAYSRACELTADRIGHHLVKDEMVSKRALAALALGSGALIEDLNIEAFQQQEKEIPDVMAFIHKVFSGYPRTTRRVIEIEEFAKYSQYMNTQQGTTQSYSNTQSTSQSTKFCGKCGVSNGATDKFCSGCGNGL